MDYPSRVKVSSGCKLNLLHCPALFKWKRARIFREQNAQSVKIGRAAVSTLFYPRLGNGIDALQQQASQELLFWGTR